LVALVALADALVIELRSGASMARAIAAVGDSHDEFATVAEDLHGGAPIARAVGVWAARRGDAEASALAGVVTMASLDGVRAEPIAGLARTLRDRVAVFDEARAATSTARASAVVVAAAPVGAWLLTALGDAQSAMTLFTTGVGRLAFVVGIAFEALGLVCMRAIANGGE